MTSLNESMRDDYSLLYRQADTTERLRGYRGKICWGKAFACPHDRMTVRASQVCAESSARLSGLDE